VLQKSTTNSQTTLSKDFAKTLFAVGQNPVTIKNIVTKTGFVSNSEMAFQFKHSGLA